jgi:hypothetical protein
MLAEKIKYEAYDTHYKSIHHGRQLLIILAHRIGLALQQPAPKADFHSLIDFISILIHFAKQNRSEQPTTSVLTHFLMSTILLLIAEDGSIPLDTTDQGSQVSYSSHTHSDLTPSRPAPETTLASIHITSIF